MEFRKILTGRNRAHILHLGYRMRRSKGPRGPRKIVYFQCCVKNCRAVLATTGDDRDGDLTLKYHRVERHNHEPDVANNIVHATLYEFRHRIRTNPECSLRETFEEMVANALNSVDPADRADLEKKLPSFQKVRGQGYRSRIVAREGRLDLLPRDKKERRGKKAKLNPEDGLFEEEPLKEEEESLEGQEVEEPLEGDELDLGVTSTSLVNSYEMVEGKPRLTFDDTIDGVSSSSSAYSTYCSSTAYTCTFCCLSYSHEPEFRQHLNHELELYRGKSVCPECRVNCQLPAKMVDHFFAVHGGLRKFVCSVGDCVEAFWIRGDLKLHEQLHE